MAQVFRIRYTFRDSQGRVAPYRSYVNVLEANLQTVVNNYKALLQPISNASVETFLDPPNAAVYGTNAEFPSVQDKAVFTFQDGHGGLHRYQVPAPVLAIFMADGITINIANTDVANYVSGVLAAITDRFGNPMTHFVGGLRQRRKLPRRNNLFILAPDDASPED